ncbi:hypothetical protein ABIB40_002864 [Pedobacter sp. UYP30]|uniref:MGH1-like glycoside hydrolase domain-containing protein n=1 Tax=Pedobacter sp. UYP30 TaxID=1756400 RepID=UPI00339A351B
METEEEKRLSENYSKKKDWLKWGPYLSERQWGTVREDYSADGSAWDYLSHDDARSRTYRWGEDGIAGLSDHYCNVCFAITLWNGKDPILKERMFGLTGPEGNHGEDVKELYYYLENTPSHSYMKHLYKYPQAEYPYKDLVETNGQRGRDDREYELLDIGIFNDNKYFDVFTEYAKADVEDVLIKITICNRAEEDAEIYVLPTLWCRNFWSFKEEEKPFIKAQHNGDVEFVTVGNTHINDYNLYFEEADRLLFTENETNAERLFNTENDHPFKKDLFHNAVINNDYSLAGQNKSGTKFSPLYKITIKAGGSKTIKLRLTNKQLKTPFTSNFDAIFKKRIKECNDFYESKNLSDNEELNKIKRQAFAGLLWNKQYYNYEIDTWLDGDPKQPAPPEQRRSGRNSDWRTLRNHDVMSMPDSWEYPWYAAWDSAFQCTTFAHIDAEFAKQQLLLFTREWYMAPSGQVPAYEWSFGDVNPPVQAWAALEIYKTDKKKTGKSDVDFLKRIFNKLSLNFSWWVNREDSSGNNVFEGGFLGLDNIGLFDRSHGVPDDGYLEQVDGTSWMALYCLNMLEISLEISKVDNTFEDMSVKFFGHFVYIAEALNKISDTTVGAWNEKDGFFYDKLTLSDGTQIPIEVKSISGMLSLTAVLFIDRETLDQLPKFKKSVQWFKDYKKETLSYLVINDFNDNNELLFSLVPKKRQEILINTLLSEGQFLSQYGIRSLSKEYIKPYCLTIDGHEYQINYEPAESSTTLFGGNSNWRGPIWFPLSYLFVQALRKFSNYHLRDAGTKFQFPHGSDNMLGLKDISEELSKRLVNIFVTDDNGDRPVNALHKMQYRDEHFKDYVLFYEYFDGDNGRGVGASHQLGWTALVANLIEEYINE